MKQKEILDWAMIAIIQERRLLESKIEAGDQSAIEVDKVLYDKLRKLGLMLYLEEQKEAK